MWTHPERRATKHGPAAPKGRARLRRLPWALLLPGVLGLLTGCVMPDDMSQMQKDLADVRQQLRESEQARRATEQRLAEFASAQSDRSAEDVPSRTELAELRVLIERTTRESEVNAQRMNDLDLRVDRLAQELRRPRPLAVPPPMGAEENAPEGAEDTGLAPDGAENPVPDGNGPSPGDTAEPDADSLYNTAYSDFSKGNYALAISGFEEYAERFPDSSLADNAQYWIGECYFSQGDFPRAIQSLDRLLERYPTSDKAAAANLKKALAYLEQNQIGQAIVQLRYVVTSYPSSDEAKIARDKLASLGAPL